MQCESSSLEWTDEGAHGSNLCPYPPLCSHPRLQASWLPLEVGLLVEPGQIQRQKAPVAGPPRRALWSSHVQDNSM